MAYDESSAEAAATGGIDYAVDRAQGVADHNRQFRRHERAHRTHDRVAFEKSNGAFAREAYKSVSNKLKSPRSLVNAVQSNDGGEWPFLFAATCGR